MEKLNGSKNLDKKLTYKLTHQTKSMTELKGSVITPEAWLLFTDVDFKTGEEKEVVSIAVEGVAYSTISATFIREFKDIVEAFDEDMPDLKVEAGRSKNNREFITITIA